MSIKTPIIKMGKNKNKKNTPVAKATEEVKVEDKAVNTASEQPAVDAAKTAEKPEVAPVTEKVPLVPAPVAKEAPKTEVKTEVKAETKVEVKEEAPVVAKAPEAKGKGNNKPSNKQAKAPEKKVEAQKPRIHNVVPEVVQSEAGMSIMSGSGNFKENWQKGEMSVDSYVAAATLLDKRYPKGAKAEPGTEELYKVMDEQLNNMCVMIAILTSRATLTGADALGISLSTDAVASHISTLATFGFSNLKTLPVKGMENQTVIDFTEAEISEEGAEALEREKVLIEKPEPPTLIPAEIGKDDAMLKAALEFILTNPYTEVEGKQVANKPGENLIKTLNLLKICRPNDKYTMQDYTDELFCIIEKPTMVLSGIGMALKSYVCQTKNMVSSHCILKRQTGAEDNDVKGILLSILNCVIGLEKNRELKDSKKEGYKAPDVLPSARTEKALKLALTFDDISKIVSTKPEDVMEYSGPKTIGTVVGLFTDEERRNGEFIKTRDAKIQSIIDLYIQTPKQEQEQEPKQEPKKN